MTPEERATSEERVRALVNQFIGEWHQDLCPGWRISTIFSPEAKRDGHGPIAAETEADWAYLDAVIRFYLPNVQTAPDKELYELCLHELMHVVCAELQIKESKREERVVTLVSRIMAAETYSETT